MTDATELALLAAIAADPEDVLPRLVYADWLDENAGVCEWCEGVGSERMADSAGDMSDEDCRKCRGRKTDGRSERAEFIRLQIEDRPGEAGNGRVKARFRSLFSDHFRTWFGGLCRIGVNVLIGGRDPPPPLGAWVTNGFVEEMTSTWEWWDANGPDVVGEHPVKKLTLTGVPAQTDHNAIRTGQIALEWARAVRDNRKHFEVK